MPRTVEVEKRSRRNETDGDEGRGERRLFHVEIHSTSQECRAQPWFVTITGDGVSLSDDNATTVCHRTGFLVVSIFE